MVVHSRPFLHNFTTNDRQSQLYDWYNDIRKPNKHHPLINEGDLRDFINFLQSSIVLVVVLPSTTMSNGPLPSQLYLLPDLALKKEGDKVRFLGW